MSKQKFLPNAVIVASCAFLGAGSVYGQSYDPAWLEDLQSDLAKNHECAVSEYLTIHESELGGRNMYIARVKCRDGRLFDAYKLEPQEEFAIQPCEIVAC